MKSESHNLDLLRAIAVLCVVLHHALSVGTGIAKENLQNLGRVGVLLFFVHTSLVLMMSLERQRAKSTDWVWLRFMVRRAFRIYPLSIVAVIMTVGLSIPSEGLRFHAMQVTPLTRIDLLSNLFLTQNLTYSPSAPGPLWSLPYEIQMYCLLPFLFLIASSANRLWKMLAIWGIAVGLALLYVHVPKMGRFNVLDFAPCFVPGVIAYYLLRRGTVKFSAALWPLAIGIAIGAYVLAPRDSMAPQWLVCLFVGLMIPLFREIKNRPLNLASHWIAKYSYGIYLGHLVCIWLMFIVAHQLPAWLQWGGTFAGTGVLAYAAFHLLENPMISAGGRVANLFERQPRPSSLSVPELT